MKIDLQKLKRYFRNLQNKGISTAEMKQKLKSVDNFVNWANKKGLLNEDKYKQLNQGIAEIRRKISSIFYHIAPETWMNRLATQRHPEFNSGSGVKQIPDQVWNDKGVVWNDTQMIGSKPWFHKSP